MNRSRDMSHVRPALHRRGRLRRHRAFTLIEVLVASVVVGTCIAGIVSMWAFTYGLTAKADIQSVAYNIGRRALEEAKQTGFQDSTEGTTTVYYSKQGDGRSTTVTASSVYSVTTTVATDVMSGAAPASNGLRTVTVTVSVLNPASTAYQCSTYLARAGI